MKILYKLKQNDYWHGERKVGNNIKTNTLFGYYNDLSAKTIVDGMDCLDDIIPYVVNKDGRFIHPVTVCQVGLGWYENYLSSNQESDLSNAIFCADWLLDNFSIIGDAGYWAVPYDVPLFGLKKGWASSLIQGQALSLLSRIYKSTGEIRYYDCCVKAFDYLIKQRSEGGLRIDNRYLYEEYPTKENSLVLNGLISTVWGIRDFSYISDDRVYNIYRKSIDDLVYILPKYCLGVWSKYSLYPNSLYYFNWASPYYHKEHIAQLEALSIIEQNTIFSDMAKKWDNVKENKLSLGIVYLMKGFTVFVQKISGVRR